MTIGHAEESSCSSQLPHYSRACRCPGRDPSWVFWWKFHQSWTEARRGSDCTHGWLLPSQSARHSACGSAMIQSVDSAVKNTAQLPANPFGRRLTLPLSRTRSKTCPHEFGAEHSDVTEEGISKTDSVALTNFVRNSTIGFETVCISFINRSWQQRFNLIIYWKLSRQFDRGAVWTWRQLWQR